MNWEDLATWWRAELTSDRAYESDVTPLIKELLGDLRGRILDVGCGEGRLMAELGGEERTVVGLDVSLDLLTTARLFGPVMRLTLPRTDAIRDRSFDAMAISLVLEHLDDEATMFGEAGRIVRPGGRLALVINHPTFTAPESAPIQEDDEVLWRPGRYFDRGYTDEKAGDGIVRFYHRSMAQLLNAASEGGWDLERMVELGATETQIERHPALALQRHIPRLLGVAWTRRQT